MAASTPDVPFGAAPKMAMAVVLACCSVLERTPSMVAWGKAPAM
ncbi:MAG: hypothetical protein ACLQRH_28765 [Acidimicrobiales bacterium]